MKVKCKKCEFLIKKNIEGAWTGLTAIVYRCEKNETMYKEFSVNYPIENHLCPIEVK